MRSLYCGELNSSNIDQTVTICGWVHRRRDHGGVIFLDVRDREGIMQVVFDPDAEESFATADRVRSEYVVQITGLCVAALRVPLTRICRPVKSRCWVVKLKC